jgi:WXG100 family type VII secretion target
MSDSSNVSISHEELQAAAGDIRSRKDELQRFLQQAGTTVEQVTSRAYKTRTASNEFRTAHNEWNQATGQLIESLGQVADGLEQTRQIDERTDQQASGRIGEIRNAGR